MRNILFIMILISFYSYSSEEEKDNFALIFDKALSFDTIEYISAYYDESGVLHIYPLSISIPKDSVKLIYEGKSKKSKKGFLSILVKPILSTDLDSNELKEFILKYYPSIKFQFGRAKLTRVLVSILDESTQLTPYSSTINFSDELRFSFPVNSRQISFLLNEASTDIPLGTVQVTYTLLGKELTTSQSSEVVERSFTMGGLVYGSCGSNPDNFISIEDNRVGCIIKFYPNKGVIKQIQKKLAQSFGYDGDIDGIVGAKTRKSLEAFQIENNLTVTGELDYITRNKIMSLIY
ncbi:TPA: peptidoglycan-binding protein, partial [Vibrio parahaemolyticus]